MPQIYPTIGILPKNLVIFGLLGHVDNGMIGLWVSIHNGGRGGDRVLTPNGRGVRVERLGGHHGHGGRGAHDDVIDPVGGAEV